MDKNHKEKLTTKIFAWAKTIIIAFIIAFFLKATLVEATFVKSGSMMPTLLAGDYVIINKAAYGLHLPFIKEILFPWGKIKRGDVVTFILPNNPHITYIKRVVGLPGDTIEIKDNILFINNKPVSDIHIDGNPYLFEELLKNKKYYILKRTLNYNYGPVHVPAGHIFVLGDNRDNSADSRYFKFVPIKFIQGKAVIIHFSRDLGWAKIRFNRIGKKL
ncbi:MAG: signal peptidase I [Deltaproteobacteria bacterium]|nr:signal peptidase I [Deltaproteobacteria bacterium]